jgi:hypothetical protein
MHFVAGVVREQYPHVLDFVNEVTYLQKAATVSLNLLGVDIRLMSRGLKQATKELVENKQNRKLKVFCLDAEPRVTKLESDFATANEAFQEVAQYFGENAKSAQPNTVFPILHRFVTAFRKAHTENLNKIVLQRAQEQQLVMRLEDGGAFTEDCKSPNVLPQIYDGAIDEIITGQKYIGKHRYEVQRIQTG